MPLEIVTFVDQKGRKWRRYVPPGTIESEYRRGVPVRGQPDLSPLGLPPAVEVALHNELFNRGIWDADTARRKRQEIHAALQAAYRVDSGRVLELFIVDEP